VALDAPLIHCMAGRPPEGADRGAIDALFLRNLVRAADLAAGAGRILTLEPLNARDRPGYYLRTNAQARALIAASGRDNVRLQLDLYHCQVSEGDLIRALEAQLDILGHVQIAGVPDRSEPDRGEVAYGVVLGRLDALGYDGFVGCEYIPAAGTVEGLAWARPFLRG
jgi:hydroxypyruvate isomerase